MIFIYSVAVNLTLLAIGRGEGKGIYEMFEESLREAVDNADIEPAEIEVGHVGNFVGELFARQGLLGGFFLARYILSWQPCPPPDMRPPARLAPSPLCLLCAT